MGDGVDGAYGITLIVKARTVGSIDQGKTKEVPLTVFINAKADPARSEYLLKETETEPALDGKVWNAVAIVPKDYDGYPFGYSTNEIFEATFTLSSTSYHRCSDGEKNDTTYIYGVCDVATWYTGGDVAFGTNETRADDDLLDIIEGYYRLECEVPEVRPYIYRRCS